LVTLHAEAYTNVSAAVLGGMVFSFALDKNEILVKSTEKKIKMFHKFIAPVSCCRILDQSMTQPIYRPVVDRSKIGVTKT
jgi:hypothetical protein